MDPRTTRGFLNNNPGNMDRVKPPSEPWQGEIRDTNDKRLTGFQLHELLAGRFCVFVSAEWGIRAMVRNLMAYERAGWDTIREIIEHWAPSNENNTTAYIDAVCQRSGLRPDDFISMSDYKTAYAIVDAIIRHECGGMPYTGKEIEDGLRLAGVVKPAGSSSTAKAAMLATTATVAQPALPALQETLQEIVDSIAPLTDMSQIFAYVFLGLKVVLALVTIAGVVWMVRERFGRTERDAKIDPNPTPNGI